MLEGRLCFRIHEHQKAVFYRLLRTLSTLPVAIDSVKVSDNKYVVIASIRSELDDYDSFLEILFSLRKEMENFCFQTTRNPEIVEVY
jgi:hypothetical protein